MNATCSRTKAPPSRPGCPILCTTCPVWRSSSHTVALAISATKMYFCCGSGEKSTGPADLGVSRDIEFLLELAFLGEYLDAIAGAIADIDESVFRDAHGMDGGLE